MKQVKVIKDSQVVQTAKFDDESVMNDWLQMLQDTQAWGEHTTEIEDITTQVEQEKANQEALSYLDSTDWMVARFTETGLAIPDDVKQKRQESRLKIKR